jgi:hypothetical protein
MTFSTVLCSLATGCDTIPSRSVDQSSIRASNLCELQELESVGYHPTENDFYYPRNLEAAQARLLAQKQARQARGVDALTCAEGKQ